MLILRKRRILAGVLVVFDLKHQSLQKGTKHQFHQLIQLLLRQISLPRKFFKKRRLQRLQFSL